MEGKKNLRKIIACGVALVCLATAGITAIKFGVKAPKVDNQLENPLPDNGGAEIDTEAGESRGIKLMATMLSAEEYDEYGVSAQAETAYTLTATITPADAENKKVDWTIAFANASSTWASGKTVTDYATVTPSADGALTAVVENVAAFGEQIVVKATSRDNTSAYATCTVEYLQRTTGYTFVLDGTTYSTSGSSMGVVAPNFNQAGRNVSATITVNKSTVYTRANTDAANYFTIKPTAMFMAAITNAGLSASSLKEYSGSASATITGFFDNVWGNAIYANSNENKNKLIAAIDGYGSTAAYQITIYTAEGGASVAAFYIKLDATTIKTQKGVESIVIDETEIVF